MDFEIALTTCNPMYFYNVNAIESVAKVVTDTTHFIYETIYICNSCNYCAIMLQLWCNYTSNDMLMWFLSIHPRWNLFMSITTSFQWKVTKNIKNIAITWQLVNNTYFCIWILLCDYGPTLIHLFATRCLLIGSNIIITKLFWIVNYNYIAIHN
jgi:hypothetical protein